MLLFGITNLSALGSSNSNLERSTGKVIFDTDSINVLPRQMRIPPRKGENAKGFLF
jgi:hypothetical protein